MMIYIANPLYDIVFKYLMEDERIAKAILSALLQKEVLDVKIRPEEHTNKKRNTISLFRLDFAATIKDENGENKQMLIELQKTWLETETLRTRQYLAFPYGNKDNMTEASDDKNSIPMVSVFLLGHRVGEINEPIVYAQHDTIIVQLPMLYGKVNNRLEKMLSIFDQSKAYQQDKKVLKVDEELYVGDADMEYIVYRLQSAAADPEMRYQMDAEEYFLEPLEDRDTIIMQQDDLINKMDAILQEQKETIEKSKDKNE